MKAAAAAVRRRRRGRRSLQQVGETTGVAIPLLLSAREATGYTRRSSPRSRKMPTRRALGSARRSGTKSHHREIIDRRRRPPLFSFQRSLLSSSASSSSSPVLFSRTSDTKPWPTPGRKEREREQKSVDEERAIGREDERPPPPAFDRTTLSSSKKRSRGHAGSRSGLRSVSAAP